MKEFTDKRDGSKWLLESHSVLAGELKTEDRKAVTVKQRHGGRRYTISKREFDEFYKEN